MSGLAEKEVLESKIRFAHLNNEIYTTERSYIDGVKAFCQALENSKAFKGLNKTSDLYRQINDYLIPYKNLVENAQHLPAPLSVDGSLTVQEATFEANRLLGWLGARDYKHFKTITSQYQHFSELLIKQFGQDFFSQNPLIQNGIIMPVQRPPRYLLLLNELEKSIQKLQLDCPSFNETQQAIKNQVAQINAVTAITSKGKVAEVNAAKTAAPKNWVDTVTEGATSAAQSAAASFNKSVDTVTEDATSVAQSAADLMKRPTNIHGVIISLHNFFSIIAPPIMAIFDTMITYGVIPKPNPITKMDSRRIPLTGAILSVFVFLVLMLSLSLASPLGLPAIVGIALIASLAARVLGNRLGYLLFVFPAINSTKKTPEDKRALKKENLKKLSLEGFLGATDITRKIFGIPKEPKRSTERSRTASSSSSARSRSATAAQIEMSDRSAARPAAAPVAIASIDAAVPDVGATVGVDAATAIQTADLVSAEPVIDPVAALAQTVEPFVAPSPAVLETASPLEVPTVIAEQADMAPAISSETPIAPAVQAVQSAPAAIKNSETKQQEAQVPMATLSSSASIFQKLTAVNNIQKRFTLSQEDAPIYRFLQSVSTQLDQEEERNYANLTKQASMEVKSTLHTMLNQLSKFEESRLPKSAEQSDSFIVEGIADAKKRVTSLLQEIEQVRSAPQQSNISATSAMFSPSGKGSISEPEHNVSPMRLGK